MELVALRVRGAVLARVLVPLGDRAPGRGAPLARASHRRGDDDLLRALALLLPGELALSAGLPDGLRGPNGRLQPLHADGARARARPCTVLARDLRPASRGAALHRDQFLRLRLR